MSTLVANAYHPQNGSIEKIWEGFSWPCLFFGFLWYMYKGLWGWGIISLILAFFTFGFSWLIFPFFANGQHAKSLMSKGYLTQEQWSQKQADQTGNRPSNPQHVNNSVNTNIADELEKLAELKSKGVLTESEFTAQKNKLLS